VVHAPSGFNADIKVECFAGVVPILPRKCVFIMLS
jgi:hypothetical protein